MRALSTIYVHVHVHVAYITADTEKCMYIPICTCTHAIFPLQHTGKNKRTCTWTCNHTQYTCTFPVCAIIPTLLSNSLQDVNTHLQLFYIYMYMYVHCMGRVCYTCYMYTAIPWSLFNDLLISPLNRALSLIKVHLQNVEREGLKEHDIHVVHVHVTCTWNINRYVVKHSVLFCYILYSVYMSIGTYIYIYKCTLTTLPCLSPMTCAHRGIGT